MSRPGQLAHGRPAGGPFRQFADQFREVMREMRELRAMAVRGITLGNAALIAPRTVTDQRSNLNFTGTSTNYDVPGTITPPDGFGTLLLYQVWASAGTTLTSGSGGNIIVAPYIWVDQNGGPAYVYGPAIASSNVTGGPVTVASLFSHQGGAGITPSMPLNFGAQVSMNGTATSNAGNVHVSAVAFFTH